MPWRAALLAPALVVVVAVACFVPFLTQEREVVAATPQPPPLFEAAPVELLLGSQVCTAPLDLDRDTDVVRLTAGRYDSGTPARLRVEVTAPGGYRAERKFEEYADGQPLSLPLPDPPRPVTGRLCVENEGPSAGLLAGTREGRSRGRLATTVAGAPSDTELVVTLLERRPASLASRAGEVADHAAALKPGWVGRGLLWALAGLVAVGCPLLLLVALRRAPRDQA